ncbi:flagellar biosynthesis protein FlhB [Sphingorhabdus soli]|uniref:Flagellar biosynthesis protein FlhB n=1 Tax=Flavisphingopyxis soli TaxID=2601267 RepID=A0A5C6UAL3_9SPHN|nr:flagellar type III secretion system protein FlhB [Sphingorhabdus soli]TXC68748.1 flagellar biosynthesis protein FlhB [Sphingorhabdus soli]
MADSPSGGGEKTEDPTQKRLKDSAKKGDVLQSKELGVALVMIGGATMFALFGTHLVDATSAVVRSGLSFAPADIEDFNMGERTLRLVAPLAIPFGALFALLMLTTIATPAMLGSLGFRWSALEPKASKMNPASGLKRMFGMHALIELSKALAKVSLMGVVGTVLIYSSIKDMVQLGLGDIRNSIDAFGGMFVFTLIAMAGCLVVIALIDVPAQMFQRSKKLSMTKQEVKDEHKESEGSPEVKQAIRQRQQEMMSGSARKAIEDATVLLVNPTHFAVALRYDQTRDAAPIVLARGRGELALIMRSLADENKVPILHYPELTRAIYYTSKPNHIVDERLYMAVASLLAFIFRLDAEMADKHDRPDIIVPDDLRFDADGRPES